MNGESFMAQFLLSQFRKCNSNILLIVINHLAFRKEEQCKSNSHYNLLLHSRTLKKFPAEEIEYRKKFDSQ